MSAASEEAFKDFERENPYAVGGSYSGTTFPPPEAGFSKGNSRGLPETPLPELDESVRSLATTSRGVTWHAKVMTDDYCDPRHCLPSGELKPKRGIPHIKATELLGRLRKVGGRWILSGTLNGWPALENLELRSLTCAVDGVVTTAIERLWDAGSGKALPLPAEVPKRTRATFVAPTWTTDGWSTESPGFVWCFSNERSDEPTVMFGCQMVERLKVGLHASAKATMVHHFAHRYPGENPTFREEQTWHAGILLEWSHGLFTTEIELAFLNAVGGYGGKANWCEDKLAVGTTKLYAAMPASMKQPWDESRAEIRMYDMPIKSKEEFEGYLLKYSERGDMPLSDQRFLMPEVNKSSGVRLMNRSQADIAGYLLNYSHRCKTYELLTSNCQTFAADFYSFLAGEGGFVPYAALIRAQYKQRVHSFLYEPNRA
jgi:hypothetical protein